MKVDIIASAPPVSPPCQALPVQLTAVPCGFPSPAEDFTDRNLDLNEHLIAHPSATYFVRASGRSLSGRGIHDGDLLIVDRSITPKDGAIVIAAINGELACKIFDLKNRQFLSDNPDFPPIPVPDELDVVIEGVVTHAVHYLEPR
ncbi:hypothetical protein A9Q88_12935 [Gammaproteobacteria bacterium 50_400_T64]|nr:hypothetical protein A9Q88_12935 [Gammaproteobacteria bacterium 50_400_T64]